MFLMKYFILLAAVAMITEIVSFFPISTATIVKETNEHITSTTVFMGTKPVRMVSYLDV